MSLLLNQSNILLILVFGPNTVQLQPVMLSPILSNSFETDVRIERLLFQTGYAFYWFDSGYGSTMGILMSLTEFSTLHEVASAKLQKALT